MYYILTCSVHIACECNPNGVDKDICDPLTGTCSCLPNAIEADCSRCEPGFWGLSQGLGCISCDCCTNGSSNSSTECDQVCIHIYM